MFRRPLVIILLFVALTIFPFNPARAVSLGREEPCCEDVVQSAQTLQYDPGLRKWWFTGTVTEIRQIHIIGMPARVARVQSSGFQAWVFLDFETGIPNQRILTLGNAQVGDQVQVSISGPHVQRNLVNWDLCEPRYSLYCSYGWLYDAGPFSPDFQAMLSPSNEFIHYGHPNPSWEQGLYWNTKKLSFDGHSKHPYNPGNPGPGQPERQAWRLGSALSGQ